jgi:hypothetical protein
VVKKFPQQPSKRAGKQIKTLLCRVPGGRPPESVIDEGWAPCASLSFSVFTALIMTARQENQNSPEDFKKGFGNAWPKIKNRQILAKTTALEGSFPAKLYFFMNRVSPIHEGGESGAGLGPGRPGLMAWRACVNSGVQRLGNGGATLIPSCRRPR